MNQFQENAQTDGRKDERTDRLLFYNTLTATAGGPTKSWFYDDLEKIQFPVGTPFKF